MHIHERMDEQIGLAKIYAEDGAFHSSARVLRTLAKEVEAHADACNAEMVAALDEAEEAK